MLVFRFEKLQEIKAFFAPFSINNLCQILISLVHFRTSI
jgi:hypothetical protein